MCARDAALTTRAAIFPLNKNFADVDASSEILVLISSRNSSIITPDVEDIYPITQFHFFSL